MLSADVMHVNGIPFSVTQSRHIHFGTVDVLPSFQAIDIGAVLRRVVNIYARGGFHVTMTLMDGAFAGLHDVCNQLQVKLNTTSRDDEHVGDVERYIRTVKERMQGITNTIPFKRLAHIMVMELAKVVVYWLNSVPSHTGGGGGGGGVTNDEHQNNNHGTAIGLSQVLPLRIQRICPNP